MTSQPPVMLSLPPFGFVPVTPPLWRYLCAQADAQAMFEKVKAAFPNSKLSLVDGLNEDFPVNLIYQDAVTKVWVIEGTTIIGGVSFSVNEYAADLIDRSTKPASFIDNDGDGRAPGGPTLKSRDAGNNYVQMYWGK